MYVRGHHDVGRVNSSSQPQCFAGSCIANALPSLPNLRSLDISNMLVHSVDAAALGALHRIDSLRVRRLEPDGTRKLILLLKLFSQRPQGGLRGLDLSFGVGIPLQRLPERQLIPQDHQSFDLHFAAGVYPYLCDIRCLRVRDSLRLSRAHLWRVLSRMRYLEELELGPIKDVSPSLGVSSHCI